MDRGRFVEGHQPGRDHRRLSRAIDPEQPGLPDGGRTARDFLAEVGAFEASERRRVRDGLLTRDHKAHWVRLRDEARQPCTDDVLSVRYQAWLVRLEDLVREVWSTLRHSLSDAQWDALTKDLFIAWEETGILKSQLEASTQELREQVRQPTAGETTRAVLDQRSIPRRVDGPVDRPG
jgi:hypothetical protein